MDNSQSLKELIRHCLFRVGLFSLLQARRKKAGLITTHLNERERAGRFAAIYERGVWRQSKAQQAGSGPGSELHMTDNIRSELPNVLRRNNVQHLVDLGCGDWTWMSRVDLPCNYLGVDIVADVVRRNQEHYGSANVAFMQLDAVVEEIPRCDAVLCREVLFHLSFEDGKSVIKNIKRNAKWLIVTSDPGIWFNSDIPSGDFRMLNLQRAPFRFPTPDDQILDAQLVPGRILGIWNTAKL